MARNAIALINPSPSPINMCTAAIAVNAAGHDTVPDQASCPAQLMDASTVEHHAAKAMAVIRRRMPGLRPQTRRYRM